MGKYWMGQRALKKGKKRGFVFKPSKSKRKTAPVNYHPKPVDLPPCRVLEKYGDSNV